MQNLFRGIRNPALRYGLMFGLLLFVIGLFLGIISGFLGSITSILSLAAYLGLSFWAGLRASQETGKLKTGLLAGFLTGVFSELISSIITLIITFLNLDAVRQAAQTYAANTLHESQSQVNAITNGVVINNTILELALNIVVASLLGLVAGAVAGFIGRRRAATLGDTYGSVSSSEESISEPPSTTTRQ